MAETDQELRILEAIEQNPDVTQASLAVQLGVAVGSVNWYLKRLINKGYVKVTHLQRRKLHYFLTPSGLALKFQLTRSYMDVSLRVYRELREAARAVLAEVQQRGYTSVCVENQNEAIEILRLTCLEQGIAAGPEAAGAPVLRSNGRGFVVEWPAVTDPQRCAKDHKGSEGHGGEVQGIMTGAPRDAGRDEGARE